MEQSTVLKVVPNDNLLSIETQNVELVDLLKEIGKVVGIKMDLSKGLTGKKVSAYFENMNSEDVLKEILHEYFYVMTFTQKQNSKEKYILIETRIKDDMVGDRPCTGKIVDFGINRDTSHIN